MRAIYLQLQIETIFKQSTYSLKGQHQYGLYQGFLEISKKAYYNFIPDKRFFYNQNNSFDVAINRNLLTV